MSGVYKSIILGIMIGVCDLVAFPISTRIEPCKILKDIDKEVLGAQLQKNLEKFIAKTPLKFLRFEIDTTCKRIAAPRYVSFKPYDGFTTEVAITPDGIFTRIQPCGNCSFSPWQHIKNNSYTINSALILCPDGSMQLFDEHLKK